MTHPLVNQLRFARSEFQRGLEGVTADEARQRLLPMNCIAWNVGHLAWQEQRYWLTGAQDRLLAPRLNEEFRYGAPASTPALGEIQGSWRAVTQESDPWLDSVTTETLQETVTADPASSMSLRAAKPVELTYGSLLLRTIYHYWYHTGENQAIRQMLGHTGLPDFVGDIDYEAPYVPERVD